MNEVGVRSRKYSDEFMIDFSAFNSQGVFKKISFLDINLLIHKGYCCVFLD